jgi:hypothetical protein
MIIGTLLKAISPIVFYCASWINWYCIFNKDTWLWRKLFGRIFMCSSQKHPSLLGSLDYDYCVLNLSCSDVNRTSVGRIILEFVKVLLRWLLSWISIHIWNRFLQEAALRMEPNLSEVKDSCYCQSSSNL